METTVLIDGREVRFRATAAVPRLYRIKFGRDIMEDFRTVQRAMEHAGAGNVSSLDTAQDGEGGAPVSLPLEALELFEDLAYIMAKHADPQGVPREPDEWLEQFGAFSIYGIFPVIRALWESNTAALDVCKKKTRAVDREVTTPLLMLRAAQLGIPLRDLELLTIGMINEMYAEAANDTLDWPELATQEDMDRYL